MINKIISKRSSVLMALLMLSVALLVVSMNSAYATHAILYETDFGAAPPGELHIPTLLPEWTDGDGGNKDCSTQNVGGGEMALEVRDGCAAYVSFDRDGNEKLRVAYLRSHHTGGQAGDHGDLVVNWKFTVVPDSWTEVARHNLPSRQKQLPTIPEFFILEVDPIRVLKNSFLPGCWIGGIVRG